MCPSQSPAVCHAPPLDSGVLSSSSPPPADRICVGVRVRPDGCSVWQVDEGAGTVTAATGAASPTGTVEVSPSAVWSFDCVFDVCSSSSSVFDRLVLPVLQSSLAGMNGTCFAYGQTSSGKVAHYECHTETGRW